MPSYNYVVRPRARANPPPLKPEDVEYARFEWWSRDYPFKTADEWIRPFLAAERTTWLRTAREALLLSSAKVAESLGTSRENYLKLERAEPAGQVSLKHLSEAAEAMGCELVYALRPKGRVPFSQVIWETLLGEVITRPLLHQLDEKRRKLFLRSEASDLMYDAKFREQNGWARNRRS